MSSAPMYSLKALRRCFGQREVLHIDELELQQGIIYGLLGPNGAGKSTLMRLLAFLDSPTSGELFFFGERVEPKDHARHRARVVWVPQFPVMFSGSLAYNIEYPMALQRVSRRQRRDRAMGLLDLVNLSHLAESPAQRLSGGEAQRASIARALAAGAQVILFDEPTANVDYHSRGELVRLMRSLWQDRGVSLLVTTHDTELADLLCHEHIVLMDGRLVGQELLPGGTRCWKAQLKITDLATVICVPAELGSCGLGIQAGTQTHLAGIAQRGAGVWLRLALPGEKSVECLLTEKPCCRAAYSLQLGSLLGIEFV